METDPVLHRALAESFATIDGLRAHIAELTAERDHLLAKINGTEATDANTSTAPD